MEAIIENKEQFNELGILLGEMKDYLRRIEQGCQELPIKFHVTNRSEAMEALTQIMEGLGYYQKLLKSAAVLLTIDFSEIIFDKTSVASLFDQFGQVFSNIVEATENEDYSLLTDLIEYDLMPVITTSQGMLAAVQVQYEERVM